MPNKNIEILLFYETSFLIVSPNLLVLHFIIKKIKVQ